MLQARGKSISKRPEIINNCVSKNDVSPLSEKKNVLPLQKNWKRITKKLLSNISNAYLWDMFRKVT